MTSKTQNKNDHVVQVKFSLFQELFEGRHSVLLIDSTPTTSKIRTGEKLVITPDKSDQPLKLVVQVLQVLSGDTYADVLRMLPPEDVTLHGNGPLELMEQLEEFYERRSAGENFGILGIRFRIDPESAIA